MNATEIKTNHTKYNLQSWSKQKGLNVRMLILMS